jgi:trans-aconitate 2-methyltransferase
MAGSRERDAGTYDRVSGPQLAWGEEVVAGIDLSGHERVLDAGCGSGRVSALVLDRLDAERGGRLICVDGSAAMVEQARERLGPTVELIHADLLDLELAEPVDVVLSTATFHWITDHEALFAKAFGWLKPGGLLRAQCGGAGNVAGFFALADELAAQEPYAEHLADLGTTRNFAGADETRELLERAGFTGVSTRLEPRDVHPEPSIDFIRTVCLGPHLDALPPELKEPFALAVDERFREDPVLRYVRLEIQARRPAPGRSDGG